MDSTLISADLYEGKANNLVQFDTIVQTTDESSPIVGRNMWRLNMYGSERPNGQGPRYAEQEQVLSDYFSSRELMTPGSTLNFQTIDTEYDMTDLNCKKVKYLCTEFSRNPSSSEEFVLTPVPNQSVLRDCMDVPEDMCNGKSIYGIMKVKGTIQNWYLETCLFQPASFEEKPVNNKNFF